LFTAAFIFYKIIIWFFYELSETFLPQLIFIFYDNVVTTTAVIAENA